jgi:hypothetical protein
MPKIAENKITAEKKLNIFLPKIAIYLSLGLQKGP